MPSRGRTQEVSDGTFTKIVTAGTLATRLSVFVIIFVVLGFQVQSDVPAAYYPEAKAALSGLVVYRDFFSTYSPLFAYVCAVPVWVWDSPKSIVLFAIVVESAALPVWLSVARSALPEELVRDVAWMYVFSPLMISTVAMAGQNHVWISPCLAASLWFLHRRRDTVAGLIFAFGIVATKFFALAFVPPLSVVGSIRRRFITVCALATSCVYGGFALVGAPVLVPILFQRDPGQMSSGNIPYLGSALSIPMDSIVYPIAAVAILAALGVALVRRSHSVNEPVAMTASVMVFATILLFSKKAYTTYWAACFFPLCYVVATVPLRRLTASLFMLWSTVATVEPSLYFRWLHQGTLHAMDGVGALRGTVFLGCEAVLILFNSLLLAYCIWQFRDMRRDY